MPQGGGAPGNATAFLGRKTRALLLVDGCAGGGSTRKENCIRWLCRENPPNGPDDQVFLPPPHLYGIVLTALHSLLRLGNVLTLGWGEVDLERGVIRLAPGRMRTRRELELELTPTLKAYLESLPRGAAAAPVFVDSLTGKPLAPQGIKKSFRSAAKRAGLGGLKFHTLRKTGATILLDAGIPLQVVQRMGGWKKPDVLLRHYAAVTAEQRQRAVGVLDRLGG